MKKQEITLSVIMPVYNGEKYLREAMDSIWRQTYPFMEFIIVNDASTDGTDAIIRSYADKRLVYLHSPRRLGNYGCRNWAARLARGTCLAMMDADDAALPERLEKQAGYLEAHREVAAVGSDRICIPGGRYDKLPHTHEEILLALLDDNAFLHSSLVVRASAFRQLGGYDEKYRYSADYDLACRLALTAQVANLPVALVCYRRHPGQISQRWGREQAAYAVEIRRQYQKNFINRFKSSGQADAGLPDIACAGMGRVVAYYTYARYSGQARYADRAEEWFEKIVSSLSPALPLRLEEGLLGIACAGVYLLRNGFMEGDEDEVLAEIDDWLFKSLYSWIDEESIDWHGWLYYSRLRLSYVRETGRSGPGMLYRQNFIYLLDCLLRGLLRGLRLDKKVGSEIAWFHEQKICPATTARILHILSPEGSESLEGMGLPEGSESSKGMGLPEGSESSKGMASPERLESLEGTVGAAYPSRIAFLIPLRVDSKERERNLDCLLGELSRLGNVEIRILEADRYPRYRLKTACPEAIHCFVEDKDPVFHRTRYLNRLLRETECEIAGIWDTDVMLREDQLREATEAVQTGQAAMSFPYEGPFHMVSSDVSDAFRKEKSFTLLEASVASGTDVSLPHSVGGAFFVNRKVYLQSGGENEHFYGWGPEDVERVKRMEILGLPVYRATGPLFHLYHPRKENSWHYTEEIERKNRMEFLKVCAMTRVELRQYIRSWEWI